MLKRLAAVTWWLGAFGLGAALLFYAIALSGQLGCPEVLARSQENERQQALADAAYAKAHPEADGLDVLLNNRATEPGRFQVISADKESRIVECRRGADPFGVSVALLLCVPLWAIAYVLGGRFWLPPAKSS